MFKAKLGSGSIRGSNKASPPFLACLEEGSKIVKHPSASGLPGRSVELEATRQVELQETPSGPTDGPSDLN